VQAFKSVPESDFAVIELNKADNEVIGFCLDQIGPKMSTDYLEESKPIIEQNDKRIKNWIDNQRGQYKAVSDEIRKQIDDLKIKKYLSKFFQEKVDIQKKIDRLEKDLRKRDEKFHTSMLEIERQAEKERDSFNAQFVIDPIVIINLVVKF
jgi:hypothetical protein